LRQKINMQLINVIILVLSGNFENVNWQKILSNLYFLRFLKAIGYANCLTCLSNVLGTTDTTDTATCGTGSLACFVSRIGNFF
jgi:hypothetical protein